MKIESSPCHRPLGCQLRCVLTILKNAEYYEGSEHVLHPKEAAAQPPAANIGGGGYDLRPGQPQQLADHYHYLLTSFDAFMIPDRIPRLSRPAFLSWGKQVCNL